MKLGLTVSATVVTFVSVGNAAGLVFTPPLDPAANYPAQALHEGIEGRAVVACTLDSDGTLTDCVIKSEEPQAYGFGASAIAAVSASRLDIAASAAAAAIGQQIAIPVVFKLGSHPAPTDTSPAS